MGEVPPGQGWSDLEGDLTIENRSTDKIIRFTILEEPMESKFLTELEGDYLPEDDVNFKLEAPLVYQSAYLGYTLTAPAGFITDFGSFRFGMMGMYVHKRPATIHDLGYRTKGLISKKKIDWVFLEAMKYEDMKKLRMIPHFLKRRKEAIHLFRIRWQCYLTVRLFGGSSYKG